MVANAATNPDWPQLPECQCGCGTDSEEAEVWLRCVAGGVLLPSASVSTHATPPRCPLLSALLTSPLLECVALLDASIARVAADSSAPTAAAHWPLQWSVTTHHLLHAVHSQLRDEAASTALASCLALQKALTTRDQHPLRPRRPTDRASAPSATATTAAAAATDGPTADHTSGLSAPSRIMLHTALASLITACLAATATVTAAVPAPTTATATAGHATAPTSATATATATVDALSELLLARVGGCDSHQPSSSTVAPSAEQLALYVAALNQLAALSSGLSGTSDSTRGSSLTGGSSVTSVCERMASFVSSTLPPTCPHAALAHSAAAADHLWSWTAVSWRLLSLHIRPVLRHTTPTQQQALVSAILRPCSHCAMSRAVVSSCNMPLLSALPAAGQLLIDDRSLTDSSAFATHVLPASTALIAGVIDPHQTATDGRLTRKRRRTSSRAVDSGHEHRTATDCTGPLLEVTALLGCVSRAPADSWQLDKIVSE